MRRAGRIAFAIGIAGPPLALGALHTPVLCIATIVLAASAALMWFGGRPATPRSAATVVLGAAVVVLAFTALQLVPMPASLLAALAPANADTWARALTPLRLDGPAFAPLSLDPMATRIEVVRGIAYLCAFLATIRIAMRREGISIVAMVLIATAVVLGIAALLHPAFGAEKVFGVYRPESSIASRHIAPLLNPNALAAYLNIGFCISLATTLSPRPLLPRPIIACVTVLLAIIQLWVASRGGVMSMFFGALLVGVMTWLGRRSEREQARGYLAYALVLGMGVAMAVFASSDEAWAEVSEVDASKLRFYTQVIPMVRAFPLFGAGRGAFESVFPAYRSGNGYVVFTHPENVLLQWSTEWGLPLTILLLVAIAWAMRPAAVLARGQRVVGAWAALLTVGLHNLVDFSSEVPGVALALVVCAGAVVAGNSGNGRPSRLRKLADAWASRPTRVAIVAGAAGLVALVVGLSTLDKDLYADRRALRDAALVPVPREAFHETAKEAMLRHPGEPYLAFTGAFRAARARDESAIPWVGHTLERAPVYAPAHLVLARSLFRVSPAQARLEYRLALIQDPNLLMSVPYEAAPLVTDFDAALEVVPPGEHEVPVLEAVATTVDARLPSTREQIDRELLARKKDHVPALLRRARSVVMDLADGDGAPWCAGDRRACARDGLDAAERARAAAPSSCQPVAVEARLRAAMGEATEGMAKLVDAIDRVEERGFCLLTLIDIARDANASTRLTWAVDQLITLACKNEDECVEYIKYAAAVENQRGNHERALSIFRKGRSLHPDSDALIEGEASMASSIGLHAEAFSAYDELAKRHPADRKWLEASEQEHREASTMRMPLP